MTNCIHHWHINDSNYGKCAKCPEKHQFPTIGEILVIVQRNPGVTLYTGYAAKRSLSGLTDGSWDNLVKVYENV